MYEDMYIYMYCMHACISGCIFGYSPDACFSSRAYMQTGSAKEQFREYIIASDVPMVANAHHNSLPPVQILELLRHAKA